MSIITARRASRRKRKRYAENEAKRINVEMLDECDFSSGVGGKYVDRYRQGVNVVVIEPVVAKLFRNAAFNRALRRLAKQSAK